MKNQKELVKELLMSVGVEINGKNPWDIQVNNENFYARILSGGSLGMGESYMEEWWDCNQLDELVYKVTRGHLEEKVRTLEIALHYIKGKIFNYQNKSRAVEVGLKHYDIGNDLFTRMLGPTMVYTCGYWKEAGSLEQAQENKMDLVCKKLGLKPGMKILDIGCGFGSFMKFAAEKYGVSAVGISISKEQIKFGESFCKGLPIEFKFLDYRDLSGQFDRVISIGMFEAVGYKNFKIFMEKVNGCLKDDGLFLLHTIGSNQTQTAGDPWYNKYIFPNGMLPSIKQIAQATEKVFVWEDFHNFGTYYDKTLLAWHKNFNDHWPELEEKYGETFFRMWNYYLLSCAGLFRSRKVQLWQMVFSKKGIVGGYESIR